MTLRWDDATSPWRTTDECARYLRFFHRGSDEVDREECRQWLDARGVRKCHRGRIVLYDKAGVEQAICEGERKRA